MPVLTPYMISRARILRSRRPRHLSIRATASGCNWMGRRWRAIAATSSIFNECPSNTMLVPAWFDRTSSKATVMRYPRITWRYT